MTWASRKVARCRSIHLLIVIHEWHFRKIFDGNRYKSISAVAKAVTGSHCNGYLRQSWLGGDSDMALEVRVLSTGGGHCAATTVRSDSGADRTTCDSPGGVSIRLRSPVGQDTRRFLARAKENEWPGDRKPCQNHLRGGPSSIRIAPRAPFWTSISAPTGRSRAALL